MINILWIVFIILIVLFVLIMFIKKRYKYDFVYTGGGIKGGSREIFDVITIDKYTQLRPIFSKIAKCAKNGEKFDGNTHLTQEQSQLVYNFFNNSAEIHELTDLYARDFYDGEYFYLDVEPTNNGPIINNINIANNLGAIKQKINALKKGGSFAICSGQLYPNEFICKYFNYLTSFFAGGLKYNFVEDRIFVSFHDYNGNRVDDLEVIYGKDDSDNLFFKGYERTSAAIPVDLKIDEKSQNWPLNTMFYEYYGQFLLNLPRHYYDVDERIKITMDYYKKYNICFDNYYTAAITKYDKQVFQSFMSLGTTIFCTLIEFGDKSKIADIVSTKNKGIDGYQEFEKLGQLTFSGKRLTEIASKHNNVDDRTVIYVSEDFAKNLVKYLIREYDLGIKKINNAFVKLCEIYSKYHILDKDINAFHMCEAPGQWIKTTEYFISKTDPDPEKRFKYNWLANSLNPKHPENIKKFGDNIINDCYGLLEKYKEKWLFAAPTDRSASVGDASRPADDGTGDITVPANIRWYRENVKNINLVTGDAGIPVSLPLVYMQKLDYSQYLITAAVASKGASCVIKCFTQFIPTQEKSMYASGFFVNLMYLYYLSFETVYCYKPYASSCVSGEFYIVAQGFLGVSDEELEKLLNIQDNFEENMTFFDRKDIPDNFVTQVEKFISDMTAYKVSSLNRLQFLMNALNDKEDRYGTKSIINVLDSIHTAKFKEWIKIFNFS